MQSPTSFSSSPSSSSSSSSPSSSWICIGVFKPRRLSTSARRSPELLDNLASISLSFDQFAKSAVLKSSTSSHVAIVSIWEKGTSELVDSYKQKEIKPLRRLIGGFHRSLSRRTIKKARPTTLPLLLVDAYEKALSAACHVVHVSWYEVSCWDCKETRAPAAASTSSISMSLLSPSLVHGEEVKRSLSLPPSSIALSNTRPFSNHMEDMSPPSSCSGLPNAMDKDDDKSSYSLPSVASSSSNSPSLSSASTPIACLSLGDVVHLRRITSSHQAHLQDALSYSCLAILKAYFPQTEGLLSYTFYRSLDGSRMAGLGVWQGVDAASAFLHAPDGTCEERFWKSMGAKARFELYEVAALIA